PPRLRDREIGVADHRIIRREALRLLDVRRPPCMVVDGIDAQADDFDATLIELGFDPRHVTEFRRTDRCKVLWMREQHRPGISDPVMEADAAFRRLGLKIRSDIIDLQRHVLILSWLISCRRVETRRAGCSYLRTASYSSSTESVLVREVRNTYLC